MPDDDLLAGLGADPAVYLAQSIQISGGRPARGPVPWRMPIPPLASRSSLRITGTFMEPFTMTLGFFMALQSVDRACCSMKAEWGVADVILALL